MSLEDEGEAWCVVGSDCLVVVDVVGRNVQEPEIRLASQLLCLLLSVVLEVVGMFVEAFGVCGVFGSGRGTGSQVSMLK